MSEYGELLRLLRRQKEEIKSEHFLDVKSYSDPHCDDFGLNQWICKLVIGHTNFITSLFPLPMCGMVRYAVFSTTAVNKKIILYNSLNYAKI